MPARRERTWSRPRASCRPARTPRTGWRSPSGSWWSTTARRRQARARSNLLRTPAGLRWTDFEDTCAGPVEWDLACLALSAAPDADEALEAYGRRHDDALEIFIEARRLQGAVWTALVAERHPGLRQRAEERLSRWAPPR